MWVWLVLNYCIEKKSYTHLFYFHSGGVGFGCFEDLCRFKFNITIFLSRCDLEAGDTQISKFHVGDQESKSGPLALQANK